MHAHTHTHWQVHTFSIACIKSMPCCRCCILQVREGVQQLSDSLCAAVERLASDLYESECHFLYEIIQNLDFASARVPSMLR